MGHRRDIEGLRALAVAAVLLFHFGVPGSSGGYVGVDVFFVISGYLITSLLVDERQRTGSISISRFYARRARRLLPISTVVLVATAVAGRLLLDVTRLDALTADVRAAALFGANLLFAHRGTDYLTASLEPSPLQHFWSLAVEEQFYVVWPGLVALVTGGARGLGTVRRRVGATMVLVVAVSYAASGLLTASQPSWSYFGLHTRAWELGAGALLAACGGSVGRLPVAVRVSLGWLGLAGIAAAVITFGRVATFPGWAAVLPVAATVLVLAAGDTSTGVTARWGPGGVLGTSPLQYVGSRSYSLYVWHWPVLILATAHHGGALPATTRLGLAIAVAVLAEIGYRVIEHPMRTSRALVTRPGVSIAIGALLASCGLGASAIVAIPPGDISTGVVATAPLLDAPTTTVAPTITSSGSLPEIAPTSTVPAVPAPLTMAGVTAPQVLVDALATTVLPDNIRPPLADAKNDLSVIYANGCHQYLSPAVRDGCEFGTASGSITIALWGDSHAAQWFTPLEQVATQRGWRLLSLTQGGCPYLDVPVYNFGASADFPHCQPWRDDVRRYMVDQGVDVVLMSQYQRLAEAATHDPIPLERWQALLPPLLDGLRADGIEPIVIADTPRPDRSVPACLAENRSSVQSCTVTVDTGRVAALDDWLRTTTDAARVGFVEPSAWLCEGGHCPAVVGDLLVYRDDNHLCDQFATWLTPVIDALVGPWVEHFVAARDARR
ncbi:MAG: acyltransferase family protein [Ilumatobacteraceae bacterium]